MNGFPYVYLIVIFFGISYHYMLTESRCRIVFPNKFPDFWKRACFFRNMNRICKFPSISNCNLASIIPTKVGFASQFIFPTATTGNALRVDRLGALNHRTSRWCFLFGGVSTSGKAPDCTPKRTFGLAESHLDWICACSTSTVESCQPWKKLTTGGQGEENKNWKP